MLDRLIDFLIQIWNSILPFRIVYQYQEAVILRLGKFHKKVGPGFHFIIPFVDEVIAHHVVVTTINLPSQSVTTLDNKQVVVKGVVKYKISDIETFLLGVFDAVDAISDMSEGIIKRSIMDRNWQDCMTNDLDDFITRKAKSEAKRWGIEIQSVILTDIGQIRSIKLFNDTTTS